DGGLFCNAQGSLEWPRKGEPLCKDYRGGVTIVNRGLSTTYACQTIIPGSENMVVPNVLSPNVPVQLAIPDDTAWKAPGAPHTGGAHYYLNPPEVSKDEACGWGSAQNGPHGNWAPYVVGSVREIGQAKTYVMLGWNPVYLEAESPWRQKKPSFGVRVNCHGDCTNTGCAIDPSVHDINEVNGQQIPGESTSKGPANNYCMVSASDGQEVEVEVFLR
ncbi:MAG: hypothetical protein Q9162_000514, partial [Coniocarpon cinnabarinum]